MDFANIAFDWDAGNREKCGKHGLSLVQIEGIFKNDPLIAPDLLHSDEEDRLLAMGLDDAGRRIFVVFTFRERAGQRLLRPVSARYMRDKEFARYAKTGS